MEVVAAVVEDTVEVTELVVAVVSMVELTELVVVVVSLVELLEEVSDAEHSTLDLEQDAIVLVEQPQPSIMFL